MKLVSWNVNGLRAIVKKGFADVFEAIDADVFALQETKLQAGQIDLEFPQYTSYWSYAEKKGYSGTAVFSKHKPLQEIHKLGVPELDLEGRIVALEFDAFWFVCVYTPNAQDGLARIDHRLAWDAAFRTFCKNLEQGITPDGGQRTCAKPVVMCGDFNVAHNEIDLKNPTANRGNAGFSDEERSSFTTLLDAGFVDTFRLKYPSLAGAYSWWSYRGNARKNNTGWRIDYFLTSASLQNAVADAYIYNDIYGSDHCPVGLTLEVH